MNNLDNLATANTLLINQTAQQLLKQLYRPNYQYKKCGIELDGIEQPNLATQSDFWAEQDSEKIQLLMTALDSSIKRFGRGKIKLATETLGHNWQMNRDRLSRCYTTRFEDLVEVR